MALKYNDLTEEQRENAINHLTNRQLERLAEGAICLHDDELQEKVEAIYIEMEEMQTPWFTFERLCEEEDIVEYIRKDVEEYAMPVTVFLEQDEVYSIHLAHFGI